MSPVACPKCKRADHVFISRLPRFDNPISIVWICKDAACDPKPFTDFSPEAQVEAERFAKRHAELAQIDLKHPDGTGLAGDHFDKDGKRISINDWIRLTEDRGYKVVSRSDLPGGGYVSTVWLGLDHSFGRGPPLIFESMVFGSPDPEKNGDCDRYGTLEEAKAGHAAMVAKNGGVH